MCMLFTCPCPCPFPCPCLCHTHVLYSVLQVPVFLLEFCVVFFWTSVVFCGIPRYFVEFHRILHMEFHEILQNSAEVIILKKCRLPRIYKILLPSTPYCRTAFAPLLPPLSLRSSNYVPSCRVFYDRMERNFI